ncbi:hypothetical protein D3C71_1631040 [compost metagenome]
MYQFPENAGQAEKHGGNVDVGQSAMSGHARGCRCQKAMFKRAKRIALNLKSSHESYRQAFAILTSVRPRGRNSYGNAWRGAVFGQGDRGQVHLPLWHRRGHADRLSHAVCDALLRGGGLASVTSGRARRDRDDDKQRAHPGHRAGPAGLLPVQLPGLPGAAIHHRQPGTADPFPVAVAGCAAVRILVQAPH